MQPRVVVKLAEKAAVIGVLGLVRRGPRCSRGPEGPIGLGGPGRPRPRVESDLGLGVGDGSVEEKRAEVQQPAGGEALRNPPTKLFWREFKFDKINLPFLVRPVRGTTHLG